MKLHSIFRSLKSTVVKHLLMSRRLRQHISNVPSKSRGNENKSCKPWWSLDNYIPTWQSHGFCRWCTLVLFVPVFLSKHVRQTSLEKPSTLGRTHVPRLHLSVHLNQNNGVDDQDVYMSLRVLHVERNLSLKFTSQHQLLIVRSIVVFGNL